MKRNVVSFALFVCATLAVFASGGGDRGGDSTSKNVELKIAWWGSQSRHEGTIKVIELYMERHPNMSITYEFSGWNDYWTKVTTMAAAGMMPDVMQQDYSRIGEWVARKMHVPLDDFARKGILDLKDTTESALAGGRIDGSLYGINLGSNSQAFLLDVDAFKKAGVPLPPQDWTWDDCERIARTLHQKLGIYGIGITLETEQIWKSYYLANGEQAYSLDGKSLGYSDDAPYVAYLNRVLGMMNDGVVPTMAEALSTFSGSVEQTPIVTGKSAMEYIWGNTAIAIANAAGPERSFALIHLPRLKRGGLAASYLKPSMFFSIASQGKHQEEAAKFISFFINDIDANKILMAERGVPISSKVRNTLAPILPKTSQEVFSFVDRVGKDGSPIPPPDPVGQAEILNNVWKPIINKIMYGLLPPDEGMRLFREQASAILEKK